MDWTAAAVYCEETYGVYANWNEGFFICPECGEPIYQEDWRGHDFSICPICEVELWGLE